MFEIVTKTVLQDHHAAEALEKKYFKPGVVASAETTWAWNQANPEALFLLRRTEQPHVLLGHLNAFPIRDGLSKRMIDGTKKDIDIAPADILPYGSGEKADLYIAAICVEKAYRPYGAWLLLSSFIHFLEKKKTQGATFGLLLAEAGTRQGQRLLARRGFRPCDPQKQIPCYYQAPFETLSSLFQTFHNERNKKCLVRVR